MLASGVACRTRNCVRAPWFLLWFSFFLCASPEACCFTSVRPPWLTKNWRLHTVQFALNSSSRTLSIHLKSFSHSFLYFAFLFPFFRFGVPGGGGRQSSSSLEDEVAAAWGAIVVGVFSWMKSGEIASGSSRDNHCEGCILATTQICCHWSVLMTANSAFYGTVDKSSHSTVSDGREESLSFFHDPKYGTKCVPYQFITEHVF